MRIRNFVYLDLERALDWLAQLQRGLYHELEVELTEKVGGEIGFDAKGRVPLVNVALGLRGGRSKEESKTARAVLEQVAPSYVARLFDQLEEQVGSERLEDLDEERWGRLQRGAIVEAKARVKTGVPSWLNELDELSDAGWDPFEVSAEVSARRALSDLDASKGSLCAVAEPRPHSRFSVMFALDLANLRTSETALNDEFELLAQVERKFGDGELRFWRALGHRSLIPIALVTPVAIY